MIEHSELWTCKCDGLSCNNHEFTKEEIVKHLESEHGIDTKKPARRNLTMHVDWEKFYSSEYDWDFGNGVMAHQSTYDERTEADLAIWETDEEL